jgi:hypothetical protein
MPYFLEYGLSKFLPDTSGELHLLPVLLSDSCIYKKKNSVALVR